MSDNNGPAHTRIPDADPMDGHWYRLDESPSSSAQMIQWYAPQTFAAIQAVAMDRAAEDIDGIGVGPLHRYYREAI